MNERGSKWYRMAASDVLRQLHTDAACGLSRKAARSRIKRYGYNTLFDTDHSQGKRLLRMILPDDEVAIEYAMIRMFYVTLFFGVQAANGVLGHAIQAFGYPLYSTANSIISVFGLRMIWMTFIYPLNPTYSFLMLCFTVSWILMLLCNITMCAFLTTRYLKGNYKRI